MPQYSNSNYNYYKANIGKFVEMLKKTFSEKCQKLFLAM